MSFGSLGLVLVSLASASSCCTRHPRNCFKIKAETHGEMGGISYSPVPTNLTADGQHRLSLWRRCIAYVAICIVTACLVHVYDRATLNTRLTSTQMKNVISDPDPLAEWPRLAWLMSFPNSGTTYTIHLIGNVTNTTTATNYGLESQVQTGVPVHDSSPNGPFLAMPSFSVPKTYIMTKTHCGGRCTECSPDTYTETVHSFERMCRTGAKLVDGEKMRFTYNDPVQRAIHLMRSPFDNLVARLHLERKAWADRKENPEFLDNFTDSKEGLAAWCRFLDDLRVKDEQESHFLDPELLDEEKRVPCHAEFYRYIQWHNLAFEVTRRKRLPTYMLYYENYTENFDETVEELLEFLDLRAVAPAPEFYSGKSYDDYFEPEQCQAIAYLAKELASPETWEALRHYFEHWV